MFKKLLNVSILVLFLSTVSSSLVFAEGKYSIKEMTPEVKAALDGRRGRFEKLQELKTEAAIGENNRGYVEALVDDSEAQMIAQAENKDRKVIYETIIQQNDLKGALSTIETVFAEEQRTRAQTGEKIQVEDGSWVVK